MSACGRECHWGCWQSKGPRAGQPCPVLCSLLGPTQKGCVETRKGAWLMKTKGLRARKRKRLTHSHCSSALIHTGSPPTSTQRQKGHCAHTQHRRVRFIFEMPLGSWTAASAARRLQRRSMWGEQLLSICLNLWTKCLTHSSLVHCSVLDESLKFENWECFEMPGREKGPN